MKRASARGLPGPSQGQVAPVAARSARLEQEPKMVSERPVPGAVHLRGLRVIRPTRVRGLQPMQWPEQMPRSGLQPERYFSCAPEGSCPLKRNFLPFPRNPASCSLAGRNEHDLRPSFHLSPQSRRLSLPHSEAWPAAVLLLAELSAASAEPIDQQIRKPFRAAGKNPVLHVKLRVDQHFPRGTRVGSSVLPLAVGKPRERFAGA